jgi:hypothetical protein
MLYFFVQVLQIINVIFMAQIQNKNIFSEQSILMIKVVKIVLIYTSLKFDSFIE